MEKHMGWKKGSSRVLLNKTRIPRNAMSHLLCAFTLGTQWKHQYDTYFGKIHWVVIRNFCLIFSLFLVTEEAAISDGQFM